jgi:hypothetical protein
MFITEKKLRKLVRRTLLENQSGDESWDNMSFLAPGSKEENIIDFINRQDASKEEKIMMSKSLPSLSGDFLKTLPETLRHVKLATTSLGEEKSYTYNALGYVYDDGKTSIKNTTTEIGSLVDFLYQSVVSSDNYKSKTIPQEHIKLAVQVPYLEYTKNFKNLNLPISLSKDYSFIEETEGEIFINNSGTSFSYNTDVINNGGKSKILLISPSNLPDDITIEYSSVKKAAADSTDIAYVDYIIETLGLIGMVPFLGEPADVAAGILEILKDDPNYLMAAISFICAIPVAGTLAAPAKQAIKNAKNTDEAAKIIAEYIPAPAMESIESGTREFLTKENAKEIARKLNLEADELAEKFKEVDEICEKIFANMKDIGEGSVVSLENVERMKSALRKDIAEKVASLKSGRLRSTVVKKYIDTVKGARSQIAYDSKRLLNNIPILQKKIRSGDVTGITRDEAKKISANIIEKFKEQIIGKEIKVFDKKITFETYDDFTNKVFDAFPNLKNFEEVWVSIIRETDFSELSAEKISDQILPPVSDQNIELCINSIIKNMENIKIEFTDDPLALQKTFMGAGVGEMKKASAGGFMSRPDHITPPSKQEELVKLEGQTLFLNLNSMLKSKDAFSVKNTIDHELGHYIGGSLAAIIHLGNSFVMSALKGEAMASTAQVAANKYLRTVSGEVLPDTAFSNKNLMKIRDELDKTESLQKLRKFIDPNLNIISNRKSANDMIQNIVSTEKDEISKLPKPQLDYLLFRLRDLDKLTPPGVPADISFIKTTLKNISYNSNPAEAFTIFNRIAEIGEALGYDMTSNDGIEKFFKEANIDTLKRSKKYSSDMSHDFYLYVFEVAKSKKPGDDQVFADLMTYVTTLI